MDKRLVSIIFDKELVPKFVINTIGKTMRNRLKVVVARARIELDNKAIKIRNGISNRFNSETLDSGFVIFYCLVVWSIERLIHKEEIDIKLQIHVLGY